ncbi:MAG: helix-hairpin-helix domain-containing protein [Planctomycetes bacterium]|nr:helix-hairpin-helix domain-containing protein [Planctomycetota bacterium]
MDERTRIREQINRTADRQAILAVEQTRVEHTHRIDALALTVFLFCIFFAVVRGRPIKQLENADSSNNQNAVIRGIDPETATWAELALLPGFGESAATKIVAYRDMWHARQPSSRIFSSPPDLQKVSGIGDKTVQRIRSFLQFPRSDPRH